MSTLELDKFAHISSPVQRWDTRWKLAAGGVLVSSIAVIQHTGPAVMALGVALMLVCLARLPLLGVLYRLRVVGLLVAVVLIALAVTGRGPRVTLLGVPWSRSGLTTGVLMALRALAMVISLLVFVSTSPTQRTLTALHRLRVPNSLIQIIHLAYRYLFLLQTESRAIRTAMRARGFHFGCTRRALAMIGNAVGMLLIRSMERADRVYLAMQARGFDGTLHCCGQWQTRPADVAKFLGVVAVTALLVAADLNT